MYERRVNRFPRRDETLSSWLMRRLYQLGMGRCVFDETLGRRYPRVAEAFAKDPDYPKGHLWRNAMEELVDVPVGALWEVGWPSSPWSLMPSCRRSACFICLSEVPYVTDGFVLEHWLQSWRTICAVHQFPLVQVPAVGAAWAMLPRADRHRHGRLMRRPDLYASQFRELWRRVPGYAQEALVRAEMLIVDALREDILGGRGAYEMSGSILVWRDLLTFSASSWDVVTSPAVAAHLLPPGFVGDSPFFRCPSVPRCAEQGVELHILRTMIDPAARRTCLLAVMDAMYGVFESRIAPSRPPKWGWSWILPRVPRVARNWLHRKSQKWPVGWRVKMEQWLS